MTISHPAPTDARVEERAAVDAATFAADRGRMCAEAAGFLLARQMPRRQALDTVAEALAQVAADDSLTLAGALARLAPETDWARELDPARIAQP